MSDSRPLIFTGVAFAVALLGLWRGFSTLSLEHLVIAVAALVLFGLVFVRTEFGLYVLIFSMLLSPEFSVGGGFAERRAAVVRVEDVLLVVIAVAWLAKTAVNKELGLVVKTPLNKPIAAYIAAQLIATLVGMVTGTVTTASGLVYVVKYVEYFVVYYMVVNNLEDRAQAWRLAGAAFITAAVVSLHGIAQIPQGRRVSAPFEGDLGEPNTFGGYLLLMMAVVVGLAFETRNLRHRVMYTGLVALMFLPFLYTLSRASYLAAIPVFLSLFILFPRRRVVLAGVALAGLAVAVLAPPAVVQKRVSYTFQGQAAREGSPLASRFDSSTAERLESYEKAIESWLEQPLLGRGVTGFRFLDAQYPRLLVESGVLGFVTFAWLMVSLLGAVAAVYRRAATPLVRGLAGGFLAGIVGMLVHGVGSNTFIIIRIMEPFWLLAAIVVAMPHLAARTPTRAYTRPESWPPPVVPAVQ